MNVIIRVVGVINAPDVSWPDAWPIPREGETVYTQNHDALTVRSVSWWPYGDEPNGTLDPFVYVVIGPHR